MCGASTFKIIQTSKGKRKLVGYFENWEATLKALDIPQVFLITNKELKWCQHSVPILKKQHMLKAKNIPNKKSGGTGQSSNSNQPKKKDKKSSTKAAKNNNQLMNPNSQKKAKNFSKKYSAFLAAEFFIFYFLYMPVGYRGS
ncbi:hypothetical protein GLOIN_2v1766276 [Rhizophagus irregularis DAOM 181602=DAOM 197198]|nr:hypothetical protein GLOIN_2v1766276 [Rhizophagus irregularis DAOM 181602=DAOM 197198]